MSPEELHNELNPLQVQDTLIWFPLLIVPASYLNSVNLLYDGGGGGGGANS